jgi:hypothetical protein
MYNITKIKLSSIVILGAILLSLLLVACSSVVRVRKNENLNSQLIEFAELQQCNVAASLISSSKVRLQGDVDIDRLFAVVLFVLKEKDIPLLYVGRETGEIITRFVDVSLEETKSIVVSYPSILGFDAGSYQLHILLLNTKKEIHMEVVADIYAVDTYRAGYPGPKPARPPYILESNRKLELKFINLVLSRLCSVEAQIGK